MRIFFDTEFLEDGKTIDLISIGMVREDGAEYYAVNEEFQLESLRGNEWMEKNVIPHLPVYDAIFYWHKLPGPEWKLRTEIRDDILEFAGPNPEWWAYFADYDWVVLCQLFGRMIDLPKDWPMYCRDLKQLASDRGIKLPIQDQSKHHALADARWVREAYLSAMVT